MDKRTSQTSGSDVKLKSEALGILIVSYLFLTKMIAKILFVYFEY